MRVLDTGKLSDEDLSKICNFPAEVVGIPTGRIRLVSGVMYWVDGAGAHWSTQEWINNFGYDPQPVWDQIQSFRASHKLYARVGLRVR